MKTGVISLVAMGLLVALGASGCSAVTAAPLKLTQEPLWASPALGLSELGAVELRHDRVVMQEGFGSRLLTVDAASGDVVWSVEPDQELLGGDGEIVVAEDGFNGVNGELVITGTAEDWDIIVPYRTDPEDEDEDEDDDSRYGVAALSGKDGAVEWKQELASIADDEELRQLPRPIMAAGGVVMMRPWGPDVHGDNTVTALDADNGEEAWQQDLAGWPLQAENDMVVVSSEDLPSEEGGRSGWIGSAEDTAVWDARNGEKLWEMSDKFDDSQVEAVVNETAIINVDEVASRDDMFIAVDLESGKRLADLAAGSGTCVGDGAYTVACEDYRDDITTIDTRDHSVIQMANPYHDDEVDAELLAVHHGRVFVRVAEDDEDAEVHIVAGDGTEIGRDAPGYPLAITDDFALFGGPGDLSRYSTIGLYEVVSS